MLNLRPDEGSAGRRRAATQHTAAATEEQTRKGGVERETGVSVTAELSLDTEGQVRVHNGKPIQEYTISGKL